MKKYILFFVCLFVGQSAIFAQVYQYFGDRAYGTSSSDHDVKAIVINDGTLLLAGGSFGNVNGDKADPDCDTINPRGDIWAIKIDTAFNVIWDKSIGGNSSESVPKSIKKRNSTQVVIACTSLSDSSCEKSENDRGFPSRNQDNWIFAIDSNGNQLWDRTYGGTGHDDSPQIIQLSSGNLIICGVSNSPVGADKTIPNHSIDTADYWVIKTDSLGNKLWDKTYGGSDTEWGYTNSFTSTSDFYVIDDGFDGFVIAGTTISPMDGDISDTSRGGMDIWIIKVDNNGNKVWDKRYGGIPNLA